MFTKLSASIGNARAETWGSSGAVRLRKTWSLVILATLAIASFASKPAEAIPAFARKHNLTCASCHSAMPYLNATGRAYKLAGFRMPDEDGTVDPDSQGNRKISDELVLEKYFPISARIKGYIFDKVKGEDTKIRPAHEIELLMRGAVFKDMSFTAEVEGEDENDFSLEGSASFGYHPSRMFNVLIGFGSALRADPYNTLTNGHRLTVSNKVALTEGFGSGLMLGKGAQYVSLYGQTGGFYYSGTLSAGNGNPEGERPRDIILRGAYDVNKNISFGVLGLVGNRQLDDASGENLDVVRLGGDFNLAFSDFNVLGLFLVNKDSVGSVDETNNTGYVEAFYTVKQGSRPFIMPLMRYDWFTQNDGEDKTGMITANLSAYVHENVRLGIEYSAEITVPGAREKENRVTALLDAAF